MSLFPGRIAADMSLGGPAHPPTARVLKSVSYPATIRRCRNYFGTGTEPPSPRSVAKVSNGIAKNAPSTRRPRYPAPEAAPVSPGAFSLCARHGVDAGSEKVPCGPWSRAPGWRKPEAKVSRAGAGSQCRVPGDSLIRPADRRRLLSLGSRRSIPEGGSVVRPVWARDLPRQSCLSRQFDDPKARPLHGPRECVST